LIRRRPGSHDNRIVLARLLPSGEAILEEATMRINNVFSSLELDSGDLERVVTTLSAIRSF
jgi:DNA-binding MarR family transcriptional regulator